MGKTGTSRLGLPYMGSKNKIANWVIDNLPSAEHFYDLFCGGGAITHAAMLRHKYKTFHMNDITDMAFVFQKVISGEYEIDYHWVSREEFEANKEKDHLMAMCWSFGNNGMDYLYSRELEPIKKACHYAVVFGDYTLADSLGIDLHGMEGVSGIDKRYTKYKAIYKEQLIGGGRTSAICGEHHKGTSNRPDLRSVETPNSIRAVCNISKGWNGTQRFGGGYWRQEKIIKKLR